MRLLDEQIGLGAWEPGQVNPELDLNPEWIAGAEAIGLTAGASAPEELVVSVIDALRKITDVEVVQMHGIEENIEFRLPAELREPASEAVN